MAFPSVYEMTNPLSTLRKQHFWEYFSGAKLPTNAQYIDDFSTNNGWVSNAGQSNVIYQSNSLKLNDPNVSVENQVALDLQSVIGKNASDDAWYLELEVQFSSASGADNEFMYGLSSTDKDGGQQDAQDFLGAAVLINYSAAYDGINVSNSLNTIVRPAATAGNAYYQLSTGVTYIFIIRRLSPTTAKVEIWNADKSTRLANGADYTIDAGINNLRYFKFLNYPGASTNMAHICNKLTFYDGTSDPSAPTTRWTQRNIAGTGTFAMADEVDGGFKISHGSAVADNSQIDFGNIRQYAEDGSVYIGVVKKSATGGSDVAVYHGFTANITGTGMQSAMVEDSSYGAAVLRTGGVSASSTQSQSSPAINTGTAWYTHQITCGSANVKLNIDGVLKVTKTSDPPTIPMQPFAKSYNTVGTGADSIQVRYIEAYNT